MKYEADPPSRKISPAGNRIGVPRSLCFDELRRFFDHLIDGHGFEIEVSGRSGPATLEAGLVRCIDEVCFPLKTFFGHVEDLVSRGVDTLLVPRLISLTKGQNLCPKFHLLPDLVEASFPGIDVLAPYVDLHHSRRETLEEHLADACRPMLVELGAWDQASPGRLAAAWEEESRRAEWAPPPPGELAIAVLGHLYAERDNYLGVGVARHLRRLGARVVHSPPEHLLEPTPLEEGMYYEPSVRTARAVEHAISRAGVDGVILLTYFACGPDSYSAETLLYRLEERHLEIPVMRLILDEQTSSEGLVTRLSTFADVAGHRRAERGGHC